MGALLQFSRAIDRINERCGVIANWLVLLSCLLSAGEAWQAAHVDEDWNMELWGRDEIALSQRAFRFAEFQAAATVLGAMAE